MAGNHYHVVPSRVHASVDDILCCDYPNETSSAVLFHGTISFSIFYKNEISDFLGFCSLALFGVEGVNEIAIP